MANKMTPYKYHGHVHFIGETQTFSSGFAKRTVVLVADPDAQYKDYAAFEFTTSSRAKTDNTLIPNGFSVGDEVEITFYVTANENRNRPGQWFGSNRAVAMARTGAVRDLTPGTHAQAPATPPEEMPDELPF